MKLKLILIIIGVIVIGGGGYYLITNNKSNTEATPKISNLKNVPSPEPTSTNRDGFPSLNQLEGITNFSSYTDGKSSLTQTEYVFSPTNYRTVTGNVVEVLDNGQLYSQVGNLSQYDSSSKATGNDIPELYSYAEQVNGLFNDPVVKVKKEGSCSYANQNGNLWNIYFNQVSNYAQGYLVCTQNPKGYLLSVQEGAELGSANSTYSVEIHLLSVGGVPPQTKANL